MAIIPDRWALGALISSWALKPQSDSRDKKYSTVLYNGTVIERNNSFEFSSLLVPERLSVCIAIKRYLL